jgi:hypothetical protein
MKKKDVSKTGTVPSKSRSLLRDQSLTAIAKTWTGLMVDLANRISK